ncbi:hypothetical protein GHI93_11430 [Lactococcus hircilactis]|uniref:Uncharacterized protein n=1 Tax=Lactococcus hircilactis TaxID=1494462 RepID=A0A7X1ZBU2_9LACT|nr:hypothetical protein [Lactococcus hircilactis]MQW40531.1 hypothetical protein [Lactococcus hircilactis]
MSNVVNSDRDRANKVLNYGYSKDRDIKVDYDDKDIDYFHNEFKKKLEGLK